MKGLKGSKRFISALLAGIMLVSSVPTVAFAAQQDDASGETRAVVWQYTAENDTLYINTKEETSLPYYDNPITYRSEHYLPTNYTDENGAVKHWNGSFSKLVIGNSVTALGSVRLGYDEDSKFYTYPELSEVEFEQESNLININNYNFYRLPIKSIELPASLCGISSYAFSETELEEIVIPGEVDVIGSGAFANCKHLKSAVLGSHVKKINNDAFSGCPKLNSVTLPDTLQTIGARAFSNCKSLTSLALPTAVKSVGDNSFAGTSIDSLTLNDGLQTIGAYAFSSTDIESVVIPSSVTAIGEHAFAECKKLTSADFSQASGIKTLPKYAFFNCESLKTLNAPYVEVVDNEALSGTSALTDLTMPQLRAVYEKGFCGSGITSIAFAEKNSGNGVAYVGEGAFMNCTSLADVTLPADLSVINAYSFSHCPRLKAITVPSNASAVCQNAFEVTPLTQITFMNEKTSIHEKAFNLTDGAYDESLVIKGYAGSSAEKFANAKNIPFVAIGTGDSEPYVPTDEEIAANKLKGTWNNGTWKIDGAKLYIYGEGEMTSNIAYDQNGDSMLFGDLINENSIRYVFFGEGITSIADYFAKAESPCVAEIVYIPNTLEKIGAHAFDNSRIAQMYPNQKVFADYGYALNYVVFTMNVTKIGEYAFANCPNITKVILPFDLTEVEEGVFYNSNATEVCIYGNVKKIGKKAFANCLNLNSIDIPCCASLYVDDEHPENNSVGTDDNGNTTGVTINCREESPAFVYAQQYGLKTYISYGQCVASGEISTSYKKSLTTYNSKVFWNYYPEDNSLHIVPNSGSTSKLFVKNYDDKIVAENADTQLTITQSELIRNLIEKGIIQSGETDYVPGSMPVDTIIVDEGITELSCSDLFAAFNPKNIMLPESLTTLNYHTFRGCDRLETVYIPNSVTSIEDNAFADCYNLVGVNLGGITKIDDGMFENRRKLKIVHINKVQTIGERAFSHCVDLQDITLPDTVTSIGSKAFYKCLGVQNVKLGEKVSSIGEKAFDDLPFCEKITLASTLTADRAGGAFGDIGASTTGVDLVFDNGSGVADFELFKDTKVINISFGNSVYDVKNIQYLPYAQNIEVADINNNYYVKNNVLYSWNDKTLVFAPAKKTGIKIPADIVAIGDYALYNSNIVSITVPESVTSIGSYAFANAKSLKNVDIAKGTTVIGSHAFENCTALRSFYSPSSITDIGDAAFKNCTRLASVILPSRIKTIGAEAFMGCSSLVGMVVGEFAESIGDRAYMDCINLEEIYIWYDTVLGSDVFENDTKLKIFTMAGSDAYRYAREFGVPHSAYTNEDEFYNLCGDKIDIYAGYVGICDDGHGDIEWLTVYSEDCENDGYIIGVCEYCSEILDEKHINAIGHDYKLTTRIPATATSRGMKVYTCINCGESSCEYTEPSEGDTNIETHTVSGSVVLALNKTAETGKSPARNVSIVINDLVVAKTDQNGEFTLTLETGTYETQLVYAYGFTRTIYIVVEDEDLTCAPIPIIGCDFNKDGAIDNDDLALFNMVISSSANDLSYLDYVDMNSDGYINAKDLAYIRACRGINSRDFTYSEIIIQK